MLHLICEIISQIHSVNLIPDFLLLTQPHLCTSQINFFCRFTSPTVLPSVLWHRWLGIRKGIQLVKKLHGEVLAWLSVWSEVQMMCIYSSFWCHCHPIISFFIKINPGCFDLSGASLPSSMQGCGVECPGVRVLAWSWSRSLPSEGDSDCGYVGLLDCTLSLVC